MPITELPPFVGSELVGATLALVAVMAVLDRDRVAADA